VSNAHEENGVIKVVSFTCIAQGNVESINVNYGARKQMMIQNTNFAWEAEIPQTDGPIAVTVTFTDRNLYCVGIA